MRKPVQNPCRSCVHELWGPYRGKPVQCGLSPNGTRGENRAKPARSGVLRVQVSRKPDEAAEALERLFGPVRRLELFARCRRSGWDAWGNELPLDDA